MKPFIGVISLLAGVVLGYPLSYYFQSDIVRMKMSLGDYITKFPDVLGTIGKSSSEIGWTALITMIVCAAITEVILILATKKKK